jgi:hypothetical protein
MFIDQEPSDLDFLGYSPLASEAESSPAGDANRSGDDVHFTVTDAAEKIAVTTRFDGAVHSVRLSSVHGTTEFDLAREMLAVADVASTKARAGLGQFISGLLLLQGQDRASVRDLVEHHLRLPTPEQAQQAEAALATQHLHDED